MFCNVGTMPSTAVMCCCSRVSGAGVAGTEEGGVEGLAAALDDCELECDSGDVWDGGCDWDCDCDCGCGGRLDD